MFDLAGRVALVSGGGGGLGAAIAAGLADFGARLAIADLDIEAATRAARMCDRPGYESLALSLDVTNPVMVQDVVDEVEDLQPNTPPRSGSG
jgi:NAD(P)-dependent dehydrogenase (short-subunit alcohol dehydrogenase family)